jgi:protease-4
LLKYVKLIFNTKGVDVPVQKTGMNPLVWVLILSGVFFVLFLAASGIFFLSQSGSSRGSNKASSSLFSGSGAVGLIEINGLILDSKRVLAQLERMEEDTQIKALVLRLNSPGGAVVPSQEIYEAVKAFSKPVVVSMGSVAASGAYYIAVGANKIFANPGSLTGSIGVLMEFSNLEKLYDWAKIQRFTIKAGKFKDSGNEFREMSSDEKALLQGAVDDIMAQFRKAVSQGRSLSEAQISAVADGRVFTGHQALVAHLVDKLGTISDAIEEAGRMGKITGKPRVVRSEKKKHSLVDLLLDDSDSFDGADSSWGSSGRSLGRLLQLFQRILSSSSNGGGNGLSQGGRSENLFLEPGVYLLWGPAI